MYIETRIIDEKIQLTIIYSIYKANLLMLCYSSHTNFFHCAELQIASTAYTMNEKQKMIHILGLTLVYIEFVESSFNEFRPTCRTL